MAGMDCCKEQATQKSNPATSERCGCQDHHVVLKKIEKKIFRYLEVKSGGSKKYENGTSKISRQKTKKWGETNFNVFVEMRYSEQTPAIAIFYLKISQFSDRNQILHLIKGLKQWLTMHVLMLCR